MQLIRRDKDSNERRPASLREVMNQVFDESFWDPFGSFGNLGFPSGTTWMPTVDISETDKELKVEANIPGYDPDKIQVDADEGALIIQGKMEDSSEEKKKDYYRRERAYGQFYREIALPASADTSKVTCSAKNGVLTITIPKKEGAGRRRITVKKE